METPDTQYVGKYYTANRETETLLFDGTYLKDGMVVLVADPSDREEPKHAIAVGTEGHLYELGIKNRWCMISHVRVENSKYGPIQVLFIATYEDGFQIKRVRPVGTSWIVKNDSIPPEKYSSAWKQKIEETIDGWVKDSVEAGFITNDPSFSDRFVRKIMKLIGEVISEAQFDQVYYTPETLSGYSEKDAEATMALFSKLHSPLSQEDFIRICWAPVLGVVQKAVEKIEKFAREGEVDPVANSSKIADEVIEAIYPLVDIYQKPIRSTPFKNSEDAWGSAAKKIRARLTEAPEGISLEELARRSGRMIRPAESDAAVVDFDGKDASGSHVWIDPLPAWKFDPNLIRQQLAYDGPGSNAWAEKNPAEPREIVSPTSGIDKEAS